MQCKEITIPLSWGVVTGKAWGNEKDQPVIAIHGYQDNANSFDNLIPMLPSHFYYICLDLPGHGKSSKIPTRTCLNHGDFVLCLKLVLDYLNRNKYILIGHSFGGSVTMMFTQIYPEYVLKLVAIDNLYFMSINAKHYIQELRIIFERYSKLNALTDETAPSYTLEEAIERIITTRIVPISEKGARTLLNRMIKPANNGKYKLTNAQNLKYAYRFPFSSKYTADLFTHSPIKCPFLIISASESEFYREFVKDLVNVLKQCKNIESCRVEGDHNVHIEYPERVATVISNFIVKTISKL